MKRSYPQRQFLHGAAYLDGKNTGNTGSTADAAARRGLIAVVKSGRFYLWWRPLGLVVAAGVAAWPARAGAAELELTRIMLSSAGVGYVEYAADVDGPVSLGLDVPLGQVDDVLKSLVVFDSTGKVGGLELPGRDGRNAAFDDVPFGPGALASPIETLNALRGVVLEVRGPRPMTGRVVLAERVHEAQPGVTPPPIDGLDRTRVTLLTADGLRQFVLEDADSVQVADPVLRARIERALTALRGDANASVRRVTIRNSGTGNRTVRVGYVASMALWKVSYRLVLPEAAGGKARLQGWAVLENATGADWNGVRLTLQYGNPVTLHQAIYRSYFVTRPEVPVEILGRLLPDVDTRASAMAEGTPQLQQDSLKMTMPAARKPAAPALAQVTAAASMTEMAAPSDPTGAAEGAEETVFTLPTPVVLAAGHTASVPILDRGVTARRLWLIPFERPHPLAAVQLTNDTGTSLPAGVLTLYDPSSAAAFAGDARLGGLPTGESRLLSFAEDLRTGVVWRSDQGQSVAALSAAEGVLHVDQRQRWTGRIRLSAPAAEPRTLLIEIPKNLGTTVKVESGATVGEETSTVWRLAVALAAGESRDVVVHADRIVRQQTMLMQDDRVVATLLGIQGLDPAAKAALQRVADLRAAEAARNADLHVLTVAKGELEHSEQRLRQNLAAVPANDALHSRLVRDLETPEDRVVELDKSIAATNDAVVQAHQALATAVMSLRL